MSMCENTPNTSKFLLTGQPIECSLHSRPMLQAISSPLGAANYFMVEQKCDLLLLSPESKHLTLDCRIFCKTYSFLNTGICTPEPGDPNVRYHLCE